MYLPKTKYRLSVAKPGEYRTAEGEPYVGSIVTTYLGESFAGQEPSTVGPRLEPVKYKASKPGFGQGRRIPTEAEYRAGKMERYFKQDLRTYKVVELLPDEFQKAIKTRSPYYKLASGSWALTGSIESQVTGTYTVPGVQERNEATIRELEREVPGITSSKILYDPLEFVK